MVATDRFDLGLIVISELEADLLSLRLAGLFHSLTPFVLNDRVPASPTASHQVAVAVPLSKVGCKGLALAFTTLDFPFTEGTRQLLLFPLLLQPLRQVGNHLVLTSNGLFVGVKQLLQPFHFLLQLCILSSKSTIKSKSFTTVLQQDRST